MSGGGAGTSADTTSRVTTSNIPDYMKPYAKAMLGGAMSQAFNVDKKGNVLGTKPYSPFTSINQGDYNTAIGQADRAVADFSGLQNQAFGSAGNLQLPGQYGQATDYSNQSGAGSLGIAGTAPGLSNTALGYGGQGAGYGAEAAGMADLGYNAGADYAAQATDPGSVQAYMNPYIEASLAPQLQLLNQQTGIRGAQQQSAATSAGAFGGSRSALANALNQQAGNLASQQAIGQGYNQAYDQAMKSMQYGSGLGIQGLQAGTQAQLAGIQGAGMGLQGLQGAIGAGQLGLQGYGQANQTAGTLANIGQQQLQGQQGIIGLQSQLGGMQQQQQQNVINQAMQDYNMAQQYPYQQYSFLSNLIRGLPMQSTTQQNYQAAPNPMSTLGGLGIAGAGIYGAMSDIRTKNNIKPVGRLKNGLTQYEFNYKPEFGDPSIRYRGVMAQEVEQIRPEAVGVLPNGYKYVNYDMIGTRMEAV